MKAFLLAGGYGSRLKPLTDSIPKCLLPICGIPLLQIWLDLCRRHGVDEILINLHSHGKAVRRFVEENKRGLRVHLFEEEILLGSAGTLRVNRHWVEEEKSFWVLYADVLTTADLSRMLSFHRRCGQIATIGVYEVPDPARCGIALIDGAGIVRNFVEKPAVPLSHLAFSGLMLASPSLLDEIPEQRPADLGFHVLPRLVDRMAAYRIAEYLVDIGTLENYRAAQSTWPGVSLAQRGSQHD
jgi:mannose-1-phosphate guanylyltransferase